MLRKGESTEKGENEDRMIYLAKIRTMLLGTGKGVANINDGDTVTLSQGHSGKH